MQPLFTEAFFADVTVINNIYSKKTCRLNRLAIRAALPLSNLFMFERIVLLSGKPVLINCFKSKISSKIFSEVSLTQLCVPTCEATVLGTFCGSGLG